MTLEELQRLTDEQLIEKVAEDVMKWTILRCRCPMNCGGHFKKDDGTQVFKNWNPLTDWNHTMEVRGKVGHMDIEFVPDGCCVMVWNKPNAPLETFDKAPQRAICLAALLAVTPDPR